MLTLIAPIFLALIYGYLNGFKDASIIVATIISSRSMSPRLALVLASITLFCGPLLFGAAVARTLASGIVAPEQITLLMLTAALAGANLWVGITWFFGIPSNSSHALVGGLIGATVTSMGLRVVNFPGLFTILMFLFLSPIFGLAAGFLFTKLIYYLARNASMRINWFFKRAQVFTGLVLGLSLGSNDTHKAVGMITMALIIAGRQTDFQAPLWVLLISATAMAIGAFGGGWRLIRTLGAKFFKIRPVHGFAAQLSAAGVVFLAALLGGPVSTTQVVSSAILGVGSAERVSKVRWGVAGQIAKAWLLTIPLSALLSALLYKLFEMIF
ncbi:MAG: inorganic phosphate transporter [Anaerolineaceae bacterium]|nr:inorganic phosphate transporter [Anaerolineaceae bacterium]